MPFDEGLAQLLRDDLLQVQHIEEKKMFGGEPATQVTPRVRR